MSCLTAQGGIWAFTALTAWPHGPLGILGHRVRGAYSTHSSVPAPDRTLMGSASWSRHLLGWGLTGSRHAKGGQVPQHHSRPISSELPWPTRLLRATWESLQEGKPAVESDCTRISGHCGRGGDKTHTGSPYSGIYATFSQLCSSPRPDGGPRIPLPLFLVGLTAGVPLGPSGLLHVRELNALEAE